MDVVVGRGWVAAMDGAFVVADAATATATGGFVGAFVLITGGVLVGAPVVKLTTIESSCASTTTTTAVGGGSTTTGGGAVVVVVVVVGARRACPEIPHFHVSDTFSLLVLY